MGAAEILYGVAQRTLKVAEPLLRGGESKLARGVQARRVSHESLVRWGRRDRDPGTATAWFHAPSVGETFQALAVIDALRRRRPGLQVVFTYFSPSAEALAGTLDVDAVACLPWDLRPTMAFVLDAVSPASVVFTRTEVWPVLAREAERAEARLALIAGTVRPDSSRLRWPARSLMRATWERLALAGAVAEPDAARLRLLGVPEEALEVTGDPRVDSAAARVERADPSAPHLAPFEPERRPTLVAGSTWPPDEELLVTALAQVRTRVPGTRMILAPHEPTAAHLVGLAAMLDAAGFEWSTLSEVTATGSAAGLDAVVVDTVGPLGDLYTVGDVAYVGGGLGGAGLHSVLEPAAAGLPVAFGPRHRSQPSAAGLLAGGGGAIVGSAGEAASTLGDWLGEDGLRRDASARALSYIEAHRGAADRTAALLDALITGS